MASMVAVVGACHPQPETPPVSPPRGPLDPTIRPGALAGDDGTTDASIVPDAAPALDAAGVGLDAGVPLRR
jgi:hypothetical protein